MKLINIYQCDQITRNNIIKKRGFVTSWVRVNFIFKDSAQPAVTNPFYGTTGSG